jgi:hypothetical protein
MNVKKSNQITKKKIENERHKQSSLKVLPLHWFFIDVSIRITTFFLQMMVNHSPNFDTKPKLYDNHLLQKPNTQLYNSS